MMPWHTYWWGWPGWMMMVIMVVFWVLVVIGIVYFARGMASGRGCMPGMMPGTRTPLDTLNERYARGEITREQYQQMRQDMGA